MKDYIPRTDDSLKTWLQNRKVKLPLHAAALGLSAAQVTARQADCDAIIIEIDNVAQKRAALAAAVAAKEAAKEAKLAAIRLQSRQDKVANGYTDAIGEDLDIVGEDAGEDLAQAQPELTGQAYAGYVRLRFKKGGWDGVNIYTRIEGQATWQFLARDTNSPYDDQRPLATANQPETREYMAIGVLDDTEIGQPSEVVQVVYGG
jgi:hypothetical protein